MSVLSPSIQNLASWPQIHNFPSQQQTTSSLANSPSQIRTRQNSDRPFLPLPIPIQRNRDRTQPRAYTSSQSRTKDFINWHRKSSNLLPFLRINAMCINQWEAGKERKMRSANERVRKVRRQRRAKKDKYNSEKRGAEGNREDEGDQRWLSTL